MIHECTDPSVSYLDTLQLEIIAFPSSPFAYAPDMEKDVIRIYSIDLRSCGRPVPGQEKPTCEEAARQKDPLREEGQKCTRPELYDHMEAMTSWPQWMTESTTAKFTFRIPAEVVQVIKYGYKDSVPFQCVSWEEDQLTWIPDHCRTIWLKSTWDEVHCVCSRIGLVFGVEIVPKPDFDYGGEPAKMASINNS